MSLLFSCITKSQQVVKVHDGDTFYLADGRTIRLAEIDCPELGQEFGYEAKNMVETLILGKDVRVTPISVDKYGRTVAEVYLKGGVWLNELLVEDGLAWAYKEYASQEILVALIIARNKKVGLWAKPHRPPFIYRKENKY